MPVRTRATAHAYTCVMHASGLHAGVCGVCEGAQKGIARAHTVLEYPCRTARLLPRMLHTHARARRGGGGGVTTPPGVAAAGEEEGSGKIGLGSGWAGLGGGGGGGCCTPVPRRSRRACCSACMNIFAREA